MKLSAYTKKMLRRAGLITVIVLLLLLVVLQIIGYRLNPIVSNLVKDKITKSTDSLYTIEFSSLNITLADQHLRIRNLHIYPNPAGFEKMKRNGTEPAMLYDISIPAVSIGWLSLYKAYFDHQLIVGSVEIYNPDVKIVQESKKPGKKNSSAFQFDPYKLISGSFTVAEIRKIIVKDGAVNFTQKFLQPISFSFNNFNLHLSGIKIDSTSKSDTAAFLKADYVNFSTENLAYQTPDSLYNFSIERLAYTSKKKLSIENLLLQHNPTVFNSLKDRQIAPSFLYHILVPSLILDSLNLNKLVFKNTIQLGTVKVTNPQINIIRNTLKSSQKDKVQQPKGTLAEIINRVFISVASRQLKIENAFIDFGSTRGNGSFLKLANCDLTMEDVAVDSIANTDTSRFIASRNIELGIKQLSYLSPDSLYRFKIAGIKCSLKNSSAQVDTLALVPRYDNFSFAKKAGYSVTRTQIIVPGISLKKIDFRQLISNESLAIESINADYMNIQAYCDQRFPDKNAVAPTINGLLYGIPFPVQVDTATIKKINIVYQEFNEKGKEPGRTTFDNISVVVTNITNDEDQLKKNSLCTADIKGLLFNAGKVNARIVFYLNDKNGKFTLNGTVEPMNATVFNPMVMPVTGAKIISGDIQKAIVKITADDSKATGTVQVLYSNLKLDFSNAAEYKRGVSLKEKAIGFFATDAADAANPLADKPERIGLIDYKRSNTQFIFNYVWKSIFEGLKGIVLEKAVNMQKSIKQMKSNFKQMGGKRKK